MKIWQIKLATGLLLLPLWIGSASQRSASALAAEPPHPLLTAVCRNDYAATAAQSPQRLDLSAIAWGKRGFTALDLAMANGYREIAALLRYSGAAVSYRTLNVVCDLQQAKTICAQNEKWRHHTACRGVEEPSRWQKSCRPPDPNCKQILQP